MNVTFLCGLTHAVTYSDVSDVMSHISVKSYYRYNSISRNNISDHSVGCLLNAPQATHILSHTADVV